MLLLLDGISGKFTISITIFYFTIFLMAANYFIKNVESPEKSFKFAQIAVASLYVNKIFINFYNTYMIVLKF